MAYNNNKYLHMELRTAIWENVENGRKYNGRI